MTTKKRTRTDRLAAHFLMHEGQWVSAFTVQRFSPLGRTQEISRVRQQYGMRLEHEWRQRGGQRVSGWVYVPAKKKAAA